MFWLLIRRWHCCPGKSRVKKWQFSVPLLTTGTGCPWLKCFLHVFTLGTWASLCTALLCPCFTSIALDRFPLFIFFPHSHNSCVWRYFHSLSLTHTLPLKTNMTLMSWWREKAGAACRQQMGLASLGWDLQPPCGAGLPAVLWSRLWPRERILLAQGANIWQNKTVSQGQGGGVGWGRNYPGIFFKGVYNSSSKKTF